MPKKYVVDELPTREYTYEQIVQWLFNYRAVWTIQGVPRRKFSDFVKPTQGNGLKKSEVLEFIYEHFELPPSKTPKVKYNQDLSGNIEVYEIEYVGKYATVALDTDDFGRITLQKGIPIPIYDKNCHLLELVRNDPDNYVVIGRQYYTGEAQLISTIDKVRTNKSDREQKFFQIW